MIFVRERISAYVKFVVELMARDSQLIKVSPLVLLIKIYHL